ncbi:MAG TPA: SIS domain-containing protein, partial [Acidimicrobiales bacterium]|nr:SIS domain-containing protein [Acidimicrobiales bacterium]
MCGIVAVLARRPTRPAPDARALAATLADVAARVDAGASAADLAAAAEVAGAADRALRGVPGLEALLSGGAPDLEAATAALGDAIVELEGSLDRVEPAGAVGDPADIEARNAAVVALKDAWWAISRDRLGAARSVADLAGGGQPAPSALSALWALHVALASLDRLEVRGRDSAGVHVLVADHGLDLQAADVQALVGARQSDPLFTSLGVRVRPGVLGFVYKTAAEIGELGDNVAALRAAVRADPLLAKAIAAPAARVTVVGHTRWASVGVISQANAHPLSSDEVGRAEGPYVVAALNGDVDNYADLRVSEGLSVPPEVTTDAKVIPTMVARRVAVGATVDAAFADAVARFDGSVAIAVSSADEPDRLHLALRGSGQSLNIGLADDAFVVASEAYGLVEETSSYLRMDGEATRGMVATLDRAAAGSLDGVRLASYAGASLPLGDGDVVAAGITTRDIDRAGFPHFLLKEVSEAPQSFRKTLRGRVVTGADGLLTSRLAADALPPAAVDGVRSGRTRRVLVIGQGTAAVAGQAVAAALGALLPGLEVRALPATELSGFALDDDMGDALVVAISQSGTTTDTNRTVDLVRGRGATVVAVVNRRNSDLTTKAHGVVYTSDGRDVEMSVASTKAFYAQVAAGWLLATALASAAGVADPAEVDRRLRALRDVPDALEAVLAQRPLIARTAASVAPSRRYWAMVGSGPDRVAAAELRIKLSELCYKAIACDSIEDKKHIDLSTEPLVLVCASGLSGPNADDAAKEVAIYRAHKAAPVVIAAAGEGARFSAALEVIEVPRCDPALAFVCAAMVGHLFGYEAAVTIDASARPLRAARAVVESLAGRPVDAAVLERVAPALRSTAAPWLAGLRAGGYDGTLEASTAVRLASLLRYATG